MLPARPILLLNIYVNNHWKRDFYGYFCRNSSSYGETVIAHTKRACAHSCGALVVFQCSSQPAQP